MGKMTQDYSKELAAIMPKGAGTNKGSSGTHNMLLKAIWKYATDNDLKMKGVRPPMIKADGLLKKLFGKDQIQPVQDVGLLKKNGHVKSKKSAA